MLIVYTRQVRMCVVHTDVRVVPLLSANVTSRGISVVSHNLSKVQNRRVLMVHNALMVPLRTGLERFAAEQMLYQFSHISMSRAINGLSDRIPNF